MKESRRLGLGAVSRLRPISSPMLTTVHMLTLIKTCEAETLVVIVISSQHWGRWHFHRRLSNILAAAPAIR